MPNDVTIERARLVAACRSSWTPVETTPNSISLAGGAGDDRDQLAAQVRLLHDHRVAVGEHVGGGAELAPAGDDRELLRPTTVWPIERVDDRVRGLVDRDHPALARRSARGFLRAGPETTRSIASSSVGWSISAAAFAHGQQRRLVDHVGQLGAGEARASAWRSPSSEVPGASGRSPQCRLRISRRPWTSGASTVTWRSKRPGRSSAGSRMSGRLVARHHDDAGVAAEAVHLDEQLVERLLALVVALADAGAALAARRRRARR